MKAHAGAFYLQHDSAYHHSLHKEDSAEDFKPLMGHVVYSGFNRHACQNSFVPAV